MSGDEGSEFDVNCILRHREFDTLVEKALGGTFKFVPPTIENGSTTHSKYAYLVYWQGYDDIYERTWEPEEHLEYLGKLHEYKEKHNLPAEHIKFTKFYGKEIWNRLQRNANNLDNAKDYRYLMTKEERLQTDRETKNKHRARLEELNKETRKKKEKPRERINSLTVVEDEIKRKKKEEKRKEMTEEEKEAKRKRKAEKLANGEGSSSSGAQRSEYRIPKKSATAQSSASVVTVTAKKPEAPQSVASRVSSSYPGATQKDSINNLQIARPVALAGIKPLAANTPRIQKKKPEQASQIITTPQCSEATASMGTPIPSVDADITIINTKSVPFIILDDSPPVSPVATVEERVNNAPCASAPPTNHSTEKNVFKAQERKKSFLKRSLIDSGDESECVENLREGLMAMEQPRRCPDIQWPSDISQTGTESDSVQVSDAENEKKERKKKREERKRDIEKLRREFKELSTRKVKQPLKVSATRVTRPFTTTLNQRKHRRAHSCEQLSVFWNANTEIEIFEKNFESAHGMENKEAPIVKEFPKEDHLGVRTPKILTPEQVFQRNSEALIEENWKRIEKAMQKEKLDRNVLKWVKELTGYFSRDDPVGFKSHFKRGIPPSSRFDPLRFTAIVCMTSYCQHPLWEHDRKGRSLVESDFSQTIDSIRYQQELCNETHRKCLWMEVFLNLLPAKLRFLESSERKLNGFQDDGPFRDDIFFHCMLNGAECQKDLFFKYNKPIGIQEEEIDDYSIDAMHMLSTQYGSIQHFRWYLSSGLDLNAIATHKDTKKVLRLYEWMKEWVIANVNDDEEDMDQILYYHRLLEMVRISADALDQFVAQNVDAMILGKMSGRWKIHFELTYPHILRCSPLNNKSNGGDGTHQVLSCLFYPQACGYRDGIEGVHGDIEKIDQLRTIQKRYKKLIRDDKGRVVLALFRVDIPFRQEAHNQAFVTPEFKLVESDEGFGIEQMTLLRQTPNLTPEEVDLEMCELTKISSPGCRYFGFKSKHIEQDLIVPGNAHIELTGEVTEPVTFVAQLLFIKRNS